MILEICLEGIESALAAQEGGADRIELCAGLVEGGTTPSRGMMALVRKHLSIAVNAIIRPRGGDSCYTDAEYEVMKSDILSARDIGLDGVVFGALTPDGDIDRLRTSELIQLAHPLSTTFHRAFDHARDPIQSLHILADLGVDRILTSGGAASAADGLDRLTLLQNEANNRLQIMPGAGINRDNVIGIIEQTGVQEIHVGSGAAEMIPEASLTRNPSVPLSASRQGFVRRISADKVRELVRIINNR